MESSTSGLPGKIRMRISYHAIPMSDNRVQMRAGSDVFIMHGEAIQSLAKDLFPLLTGENDTNWIVEKLASKYPKDVLVNVIRKLLARRVLENATMQSVLPLKREELECFEPQLTYFSHFSENPLEQQGRLHKASVAVCGLGPLGIRVSRILASSGVGRLLGIDGKPVSDEDVYQSFFFRAEDIGKPRGTIYGQRASEWLKNTHWEGREEDQESVEHLIRNLTDMDYLVVCSESLNPLFFESVNKACNQIDLTWTSCVMEDHTATVGPTVIPKQTACWKCYDLRVKANIDHYEEYLAFDEYLRKSESNPVRFGYLLPSLDLIAGLTALEVIKDLSGLTPPLTYGAQISVNLLTTEFDLHPVLKLPRCPVCGRLNDQGAMVRPFLEKVR